jgi:hypothetical protein
VDPGGLGGGELLDGASRGLALRAGEEVAGLDAMQFAA